MVIPFANPTRKHLTMRAWRKRNSDRVRTHNRDFYLKNTEQVKYNVRSYRLRKKYNLTPDEYDQLLEAQGGHCIFCSRTNEDGGRKLVLDHCHKTGRVRGFLCVVHNSALAAFGDDTEGILKVLDYLKPKNGNGRS